MAAVNVNIKMDESVKKEMEQVCYELGITMSSAFTIFSKKVTREKRIPFDVSIDPFYSEIAEKTAAAAEKSTARGTKAGKARSTGRKASERD